VAGQALDLIPYALIATASPLGLAAALTVLHAGRAQALTVAAGALVGQLLACSIFVAIGAAVVQSHREKQPHVEGVLEVGLGATLIAIAVVVRRGPHRAQPRDRASQQILERLGRLSGFSAFIAGLAIGVGGPKRLVLTSLASASITAASLDAARTGVLVLWYSVLATAVIWIPVLAAVIAGQPVLDGIDSALRWFTRHQRPVIFYSLLVVSTFLIAHGLLLLGQAA
jgi:hypothetical protein